MGIAIGVYAVSISSYYGEVEMWSRIDETAGFFLSVSRKIICAEWNVRRKSGHFFLRENPTGFVPSSCASPKSQKGNSRSHMYLGQNEGSDTWNMGK